MTAPWVNPGPTDELAINPLAQNSGLDDSSLADQLAVDLRGAEERAGRPRPGYEPTINPQINPPPFSKTDPLRRPNSSSDELGSREGAGR